MLESMGFLVISLPPSKNLPKPVSSHADMLIFKYEDNLILQREYYNDNLKLFDKVKVKPADFKFGKKYPEDIKLNALAVADTLYGRIEHVCSNITELYTKKVNLNQGYAKCSTLLLPDNSAITADKTIADSLNKSSHDVLFIREGGIKLPGYNYGFIGGASTVYKRDVIFFGDIRQHFDFKNIQSFINAHGCDLIYCNEIPLFDLGGAVIVDNP